MLDYHADNESTSLTGMLQICIQRNQAIVCKPARSRRRKQTSSIARPCRVWPSGTFITQCSLRRWTRELVFVEHVQSRR
jgi:hypothetical protein